MCFWILPYWKSTKTGGPQAKQRMIQLPPHSFCRYLQIPTRWCCPVMVISWFINHSYVNIFTIYHSYWIDIGVIGVIITMVIGLPWLTMVYNNSSNSTVYHSYWSYWSCYKPTWRFSSAHWGTTPRSGGLRNGSAVGPGAETKNSMAVLRTPWWSRVTPWVPWALKFQWFSTVMALYQL